MAEKIPTPETDKEWIDHVIKGTELGIDDLEEKLNALPPNERYKVQWLPKNIEDRIKIMRENDPEGISTQKLDELESRFNEIVERFDLDKKYFGLK